MLPNLNQSVLMSQQSHWDANHRVRYHYDATNVRLGSYVAVACTDAQIGHKNDPLLFIYLFQFANQCIIITD